jgi:hypothetical protein
LIRIRKGLGWRILSSLQHEVTILADRWSQLLGLLCEARPYTTLSAIYNEYPSLHSLFSKLDIFLGITYLTLRPITKYRCQTPAHRTAQHLFYLPTTFPITTMQINVYRSLPPYFVKGQQSRPSSIIVVWAGLSNYPLNCEKISLIYDFMG